jgi:hypothetical protein
VPQAADGLECKCQIACRLEPPRRLFLQTVGDHTGERRRHRSIQRAYLRRILAQNRRERFGGRLAMECGPAAEHLVKDSANREDIGAVICGFTARLLRRHVIGCPHHPAGFGKLHNPGGLPLHRCRFDCEQLGQAKVDDLQLIISTDEDILRLQVTVHDSFLVCGDDAFGELKAELDGLFYREWTSAETPSKRLPFEQFRYEIRRPVVGADVMNGDDVRMIEARRGHRFLLEPSQTFGIGRNALGDDFDRNIATQARVARAIDLTHAAAAEQCDHLVRTDSRARR